MSDAETIRAVARAHNHPNNHDDVIMVPLTGTTAEDAEAQAALMEDESDRLENSRIFHNDTSLGPEATTYGTETPATPDVLQAIAAHQAHDPTLHPGEQPSLWPEIRGIIETHIRNQPRSLQVELGPSELGTTCLHCLAAKLAGWPRQSRPSWGAYRGTAIHAQFEKLFDGLNKTGSDPENTNRRWETEMPVTVGRIDGLYGGYEITGHIDLFDRLNHATADWKLTSKTTIKLVKAHGPSQQYLVQASLYGIGLQNAGEEIQTSCIYFLPGDEFTLNNATPIEYPFNPNPGLWALSRARLLVNLMDCIEQADGAEVRDAWISRLPKATDHCFDCGTWPDDNLIAEINDSEPIPVPDKWIQLASLLEPIYPGDKS